MTTNAQTATKETPTPQDDIAALKTVRNDLSIAILDGKRAINILNEQLRKLAAQ